MGPDVVGIVIVLIISVGIGIAALRFRTKVMPLVEAVVNFITTPITSLFQLLHDFASTQPLIRPGGPLAVAFPHLLFGTATIGVVTYWVSQWQNSHDLAPLAETLLYNTTFGSFVTILNNGFDFEPATIIAAGFSSLLASTCMRSARNVHWAIRIFYSIVFICTTATLGSCLSGYFPAIAQWFTSLRNNLSTALSGGADNFWQLLAFLGRLIPFLLLTYIAIVLLVLIVQEYLNCVCYGLLILIGFILICLPCQHYYPDFGAAGHWTNILMTVLFLVGIIGTDALRNILE